MKYLKNRVTLCSLFAALILCGCTGHGSIYDLKTGESAPLTYSYGSGGRGKITTSLKGHIISGEYSFASSTEVSWGSIYANANTPQGVVTGTATGTSIRSRGGHRGNAVLTDGKGLILDCELLAGSNAHGSGGCQDNQGNKYRILF